MEQFDYLKVCKDCVNKDCCVDPFPAFLAKDEIKPIQNKLKKLKLKILKNKNDFFEIKTVNYDNQQITSKIIKKINEKCFFLKDDETCMVHEVNPFDCKLWPVTYDYFADENKLVIYLGDCLLAESVPQSWIDSTVEQIIKKCKKKDKKELIAYSLLPDVKNYKIIKEVPDFL